MKTTAKRVKLPILTTISHSQMSPRPTLDKLRRAIRIAVCRQCRWAPRGCECQSPDVPRTCEADCPIFVHLGQLKNAGEHLDPMLRHRPTVLQSLIQNLCRTERKSAGIKGRVGGKLGPLRQYVAEVAKAIDSQMRW